MKLECSVVTFTISSGFLTGLLLVLLDFPLLTHICVGETNSKVDCPKAEFQDLTYDQ